MVILLLDPENPDSCGFYTHRMLGTDRYYVSGVEGVDEIESH